MRAFFDCLPDDIVTNILDKVWHDTVLEKDWITQSLVCKRWNIITLGNLAIYFEKGSNNKGVILKLGKQNVRKLVFKNYMPWISHNDYTWLESLGGTLEEVTIEADIYASDRMFDLQLLSQSCPKLKYLRLYRMDAVHQSDKRLCTYIAYEDRNQDLALMFPALRHCNVDRMRFDLAKLVNSACPVLERLEAFMYNYSGEMLCSSTLTYLSLEMKCGFSDLNLQFPNLQEARIGICNKLELNAPRLKHLSLNVCRTSLTLNVSNPLESLEFSSGLALDTIALVDKVHFKSVSLNNNIFWGSICGHKVVEKILGLEQFRECEVLRVKRIDFMECECEKKSFDELPMAKLKTLVLQVLIKKDEPSDLENDLEKDELLIEKDELSDLERDEHLIEKLDELSDLENELQKMSDLVNALVKHCPALPHICLLKIPEIAVFYYFDIDTIAEYIAKIIHVKSI